MLASADIRMRWFCVWIGLGGPSFSLISESQWSARRVLGRVSFETLQFVSPFPASLYCSRVILNQTITTGVFFRSAGFPVRLAIPSVSHSFTHPLAVCEGPAVCRVLC